MRKKQMEPLTKGVARVPVMMQMEMLECGAVSLAMIMAYYDKWMPFEQVRADCGVSRDGSSAKKVLKAARAYGFEANGFRYEPEMLRESGQFPCIIHWNMNHFVVLCGFRGNKAYINDPAHGRCVVTMEEFDQAFTGVVLTLKPGEKFEPSGRKKSVLGFARKRLQGAKTALVFMFLTSVIAALMALINPVFSRIFMDRILTGESPAWLLPFLGALAAVSGIQIIASWVQAVYSLKTNGRLAIMGNTSYMWKVLRLPMDFFSQRMAGDIQQRKDTNADIAKTLIETLAPLAVNTVMMIVYLIVMLRYSPLLAGIGILSILINLLLSQVISYFRMNIVRVQMRDEGRLAGATVSGIEIIESIKASGAEYGYFEKWADCQASVNRQRVRYEKLSKYLGTVPVIVTAVTSNIVLLFGIWLAVQGQFTIGMIMAFQGFLTAFSDPAMQLISAGQTIQEMRTDMERIDDVMEYPAAVEESIFDEDKEYDKLTGQIELKNVTFGYSLLDPPLIKDFSMSLKPGSRVAFVGASGCGKSTLSKLISGLYQPWSGEILFDGKPISEIDRSVFTGSLAVVDQDITLFEDTISANIRMWDESIEDFEIIMAARDAHIHQDIVQRDGGYDHRMLEGGKDFSGGQRQRIEIARVLAQDPTIIILDEATSALDARTEFDVVQSIKDRGITCIVVAHRLSTIRDCDEIVVLDHGEVAERGTHEELYAKGGLYAALVTSE